MQLVPFRRKDAGLNAELTGPLVTPHATGIFDLRDSIPGLRQGAEADYATTGTERPMIRFHFDADQRENQRPKEARDGNCQSI